MEIDKKQLLLDMGNRYYQKRKELKLTQEDAAEIAGITQQAISDAELGKGALQPDSMLKLCLAYGMSCDYLLTGNISDSDSMRLDKQIQCLDADTFFHYQSITEHFLSALGIE